MDFLSLNKSIRIKFFLLIFIFFNLSFNLFSGMKTVKHLSFDGLIIRNVKIKILELFPETKSKVKKIVNKLHVLTREYVVYRELLYKKGDKFDIKLIEESERNLRKNKNYIVYETEFYPSDDGKYIDVLVTVQDIWTLYMNVQIEHSGGVGKYNFTIGERNFVGRNFSLEFKYDRNPFRKTWQQQFHFPFLFGSRWQLLERTTLHLEPDNDNLGEGVELYLTYPLFSKKTEWGFIIGGKYDKSMEFEYTGPNINVITNTNASVKEKYFYRQYYVYSELVRSFGYKLKRNYGIKLSFDKKEYWPYEGLSVEQQDLLSTKFPTDEGLRSKLSFIFSVNKYRYIKLRNFFYYNRIEDYSIGFNLEGSIGISRKFWGSDEDAYYIYFSFFHSFFLNNKHILSFKLSYQCDFPDDPLLNNIRDSIFIFNYNHYVRDLPLGFLAMRAIFKIGAALEDNSLFQAGGDSGLRGYLANQYEGRRLALINIEYRFDPIIIDFFHIGFVLFYDMGAVWDNDREKIPFYPAVGIGLRFSMPQLNPNIYRFDFGFNFGRDGKNFENVFSAGMSQVF